MFRATLGRMAQVGGRSDSAMSDGGRRGGREARRQLRAAPLEEALRPVRAGPGRRALQAAERGRHQDHPRGRPRCARAVGYGAGPAVLHRGLHRARRLPQRVWPAQLPAGAGRGRHRRCSPPLPALWPGPPPRPRALGQQGPLRHGRRCRAHGRPQDPRVPRIAAAGPLRRRAHRRLARPHPLLPALAGAARHGRRHGARPQHALRLHLGHHQACRHQLLPRRHARCRA